MNTSDTLTVQSPPVRRRPAATIFRLLWADKSAVLAVSFLLLVVLAAIFGPVVFGDVATKQNWAASRAPFFSINKGWLYVLGGDLQGRPVLARIIVATRNTIAITFFAVLCSSILGSTLGLVAGYSRTRLARLIPRLADVIMSFPSLLLAVIVLYILPPSIINLVVVLAITRIPVYLRTTRAEVLEIRERMFVQAARVMGASNLRIILFHILPMLLPTLLTVATLDFAIVMLAESSLSFLGIGIQAPQSTWGLLVAQGKPQINVAWWLSVWPGIALILTSLSLNMVSIWLRTVLDPMQRWRLEGAGSSSDE